MKTRNIYSGLVMTAAALLCLAGCKKDEEGEKIMLGTQFEKAVSAQKTYLGENNTVCWSTGDEVKVNGKSYTVSAEGVAVDEAANYYAVYPATAGNSADESGGTVEIPAVQTYTNDGNGQVLNGPMAARLDGKSGKLYFRNLYSLLKVTVAADGKDFTVNSITVTATGETPKALAGSYTFEFNGATTTGEPTVSDDITGSTTVTLTCGSDNTVSANDDKDFYLVVHPLTTAQKLTVKVNGVLAGMPVAYTYHTASARTLNRSCIGGLSVNLQQLEPVMGGIGVFTINAEGKQVTFSPGNLQYNLQTEKWRFAPNQWDILETNSLTIGTDYATYKDQNYNEGWMGLFGYGTSGNESTNPYMTSTTPNNYPEQNISNTEYDWGVHNEIYNPQTGHTDGKNIWRTLTYDEYHYIVFERSLSTKAQTNVSVDGKKGAILVPDDGSQTLHENKIYTKEEWKIFEAKGYVFLPAEYWRQDNASITSSTVIGYYWTSTISSTKNNNAKCMGFNATGFYEGSSYPKYDGFMVRLVRDIN